MTFDTSDERLTSNKGSPTAITSPEKHSEHVQCLSLMMWSMHHGQTQLQHWSRQLVDDRKIEKHHLPDCVWLPKYTVGKATAKVLCQIWTVIKGQKKKCLPNLRWCD